MPRDVYEIRTDLPPEAVNQIGLEIFKRWLDFALGGYPLGGRRLVYPSGRYASSIQYKRTGEATVAIISDEGIAPHAGILEHGHGPVDLKTKLQWGRAYPMHRRTGKTKGTNLRRIGSGPPRPSMWAEVRAAAATGFASIGPQSAPGSWIIPPMSAYAPVLHLVTELRALIREAEQGR